MIRIENKKELIYDSATQQKGIIIVEMLNWSENGNGAMTAEINYIVKNPETSAEMSIAGKNKTIAISEDKYNVLYQATQSMMDNSLTFFEENILRKQLCLLLYVQTDVLEGTGKCIYGSEPQDWVIC